MHPSTFIWFSSIDWDDLWQCHQELALRFARDGHAVLFVDTLGIRQPTARDLGRLGRRVANRLRGGVTGVRRAERNLSVYSPVVIPRSGPVVDRLNRRCLLWPIQRWLTEYPVRPRIVWTFLPHPVIFDFVSRVETDLLVYYAVNPILENVAGVSPAVARAEQRLLDTADVTFAGSPSLMRERTASHRAVHLLSFGVHPDRFAADEYAAEPHDLAPIRRPRIGFFGTIGPWLDIDLIRYVARARPAWSIVMLGPVRTDVTPLESLDNVYFVGARPHRDLPAYLAGFDVLLMPYRLNAFTARIFPGKTYECLATGKPVVATALPDLEPLADLIYLSPDRAAFVSNVERALAESSALAQRRQACARANSWEARYAFAVEKLEEHLDRPGGRRCVSSRS